MSKWTMRTIAWNTVIGQHEDGSDRFADSLPVWAYNQLKAAPEMLEFIRATSKEPCEDIVSVRAGDYCHYCVSCDARALIAKIEGEEKPND